MRFIIRLLINAVGFYAAVYLLGGTYIFPESTNWTSFLWLALIFGLVNAIIRPLLMVVSCPLIILTLGLGTLLINTAMFWLAGVIGTQFGVGFTVNGFVGAFLGALVVSVVSFVLSLFFNKNK
ncbi:MAG TPA: phage holin family protein [Bellilinea sp.]|nr:phage holin family protein [Bellilinea sp.]